MRKPTTMTHDEAEALRRILPRTEGEPAVERSLRLRAHLLTLLSEYPAMTSHILAEKVLKEATPQTVGTCLGAMFRDGLLLRIQKRTFTVWWLSGVGRKVATHIATHPRTREYVAEILDTIPAE